MPHIPSTGVDAGPSSQILDHRPEIRAAWDALDETLLGPGSTLPVSLKENVRREYEAMRAERAVAQA
jgi:hypothetical protein